MTFDLDLFIGLLYDTTLFECPTRVRNSKRDLFRYFRDDVEVHTYGSYASGLCSMTSDADFTAYFDCFTPSIDELADTLKDLGYQLVISIPHAPGQLLIDFFNFYGYIFDYASQEVYPSLGKIQKRSIIPPARSSTDSRPKDWPICILDPFITDRNVAGNCGRDNVVKIRDSFRNVYDALKNIDIKGALRP
ncbi:hypothetical protein KI688_001247 [Linnemannia hyalina]|uniref:Polymerase nucleotidyl transferase domain-containing protein n=1 Tax=Linnemannia hyalina TaxID=64524 RepID=A0A9P7XTP2_9FUNG|nr:hypothetical protein KI688_001247 [Linnemannia hyalina]